MEKIVVNPAGKPRRGVHIKKIRAVPIKRGTVVVKKRIRLTA